MTLLGPIRECRLAHVVYITTAQLLSVCKVRGVLQKMFPVNLTFVVLAVVICSLGVSAKLKEGDCEGKASFYLQHAVD